MQSSEATLRNDKGKIVTVADRDLVLRFLKHECPDGDYTVEGQGLDAIFYRHNGVVYPAGGDFDGVRMPPRSLQECISVFVPGHQAQPEHAELTPGRQSQPRVWVTSNLNGWAVESCQVPDSASVAVIARWMSEPDSRNPSVVRWLSDGVAGDFPVGITKVTAQWHHLGEGAGKICTGTEENLGTIALVFRGDNLALEEQQWHELAGNVHELPSQRPLIVLFHKETSRTSVRDGQHRLKRQPGGPSTGLAFLFAFAFLDYAETAN